MGIIANYTKIDTFWDINNPVQQEITIPEDVSENDPYYESRGKTITIDVPSPVENNTLFENVYICIENYIFYKNVRNETGYLLDIKYRVYQSKEIRDQNEFNYILEDDILGSYIPVSPGDDIRNKGYEVLKNQVYVEYISDDPAITTMEN